MTSVKFILAAAVAAVFFSGGAESCSPPMGPQPVLTKAQKAHFADSILVGKITDTYIDRRLSFSSEHPAYSATMDVYCIYKGKLTDSVVNITQVGIIPGFCISTALKIGSEYVVYLSEFNNRISEVEMENTPAVRYNVSRACGLDLRYPEGKLATDIPHHCPKPAMDTECIPKYVNKEPFGLNGQNNEGNGHEGNDNEGNDNEGNDNEGNDNTDMNDAYKSSNRGASRCISFLTASFLLVLAVVVVS